MKNVFKFIGKFLLWMIAYFVLYFVIMVIAIATNEGNPVSGANCSFLSIIIISLLHGLTHRKKKNKEDDAI